MILTFFLQYFNYFGEVILSSLIYFWYEIFFGERIIKIKNPRFIIWYQNPNMRPKNPQFSPRVLELLRISRIANEKAIKYDMHG